MIPAGKTVHDIIIDPGTAAKLGDNLGL